MDKKRWEQDYPQMSEVFHKAVARTVEEQISRSGIHTQKRKNIPWKQCILLGAIIAAMWGTFGITAEKQFDFCTYLIDYGLITEDETETCFLNSMEYEVTEENQLLEIHDIMYDGAYLAIYATATEEGKKYSLGADKLYIGEQNIAFLWTEELKKGEYVFITDLYGVNVSTDFTVQIQVVAAKDGKEYENPGLSFHISADVPVLERLPDQKFITDDYTVIFTELSKINDSLRGKVQILMTEKQKRKLADQGEDAWVASILLEGNDGTVWKNESRSFIQEKMDEAEKDTEGVSWRFHFRNPGTMENSANAWLMAYSRSEEGKKINKDKFDVQEKYGEKMIIKLK